MLSLPEKVLLFALDDDTGKICHLPEQYLDYALAGALVMELALQNRLHTTEDATLRVLDKALVGNTSLDAVLELLPEVGENVSLEKALAEVSAKTKEFMEDILQELVDKEILKREDYRYLLVFSKECYPMVDPTEEIAIRTRLRDILLSEKAPRDKDTILIGITHVCNLLKPIFTDSEWESVEPRLHALTKHEVMSQTIAKILELIQQAVLLVVTNAG